MEKTDQFSLTGWQFHYDETCPPGTDSFLLSSFPQLKPRTNVCDLGAGSGLLSMLLLRREPTLHLTCVEYSDPACRLAERNAAENGLGDHLQICQADLRQTAQLPPAGSFDLVVSNPPYFPVGAGAASPNLQRRRAREECTCTLPDVCRAAAYLLRWNGAFCLVHRPERLADLCACLRQAGLEPKRLRLVQQTAERTPSLLLMEGRRGGNPGLRIEPPLILQTLDGQPTQEVDAIYYRTTEDAT